MMLLCAFDLPRETKEERKAANKYRKRLVELGFAMKQFSLYEREVRHIDVKNRFIDILREELPDTGAITLYLLPNEVNDTQITILGEKSVNKTVRVARIIFL